MTKEQMLSALTGRMMEYYSCDPERIHHFLKVYAVAKMIGIGENLSEDAQFILEAAALTHDIGIKLSEIKYGSSAGEYQEIEGPAEAERVLTELGFEQSVIERVCFLIGHHHTYDKINEKDYQILVEADFMVNAFEENMNLKSVMYIKNKIFRTETGKKFFNDMYLGARV